jgi:two-component system, cell cycle response regulator
MQILIAEDDNVSRRILENMLTKWGHDVVSVVNGAEAWEKLQEKNSPRLAILDWMMPEMDGIEVCQKVREAFSADEKYYYLIMLTAKTEREDIIAGMEAGADDYITKPFDKHELRVRLRAGERIINLQSQLTEAQRTLKKQATVDGLTGVLNRRAILDQLARDIDRARRDDGRLSVAYLDLDHFKKVNDTWGHPAGDAVLKETARRLNAITRRYDAIGRLGGEEFLLIFPDASLWHAAGIVERVRKAFDGVPVDAGGQEITVTASIGVAALTHGMPLDLLVKAADQALYRAKENGRNRAELSRPLNDDDAPAAETAENG